MTIGSKGNVLFDVRKYATAHEEMDFALTVVAERILLVNKEYGETAPDIEKSVKVINNMIMDKVKELQKHDSE